MLHARPFSTKRSHAGCEHRAGAQTGTPVVQCPLGHDLVVSLSGLNGGNSQAQRVMPVRGRSCVQASRRLEGTASIKYRRPLEWIPSQRGRISVSFGLWHVALAPPTVSIDVAAAPVD